MKFIDMLQFIKLRSMMKTGNCEHILGNICSGNNKIDQSLLTISKAIFVENN